MEEKAQELNIVLLIYQHSINIAPGFIGSPPTTSNAVVQFTPLIEISDARMAVQVTTTTLFNNPTTSPINSQVHSHSSIPIGAIIGGAVAGSALAVLATVSWIYWGRQIQKTKRKQEERVCVIY